jgi:hypothetical protein
VLHSAQPKAFLSMRRIGNYGATAEKMDRKIHALAAIPAIFIYKIHNQIAF